MDVFKSRFYRINIVMLSLIGVWPYQKHKKLQYFQRIMCGLIVFSVAMPQVIRLTEIWGQDFDMAVEIITPVSIEIVAGVKFINIIVHRKELLQLLETIKEDWSSLRNKKEVEILMKFADEGRNLTLLYTVSLYGATFSYLMIPLLPKFLDVVMPLNESRTPEYLYHSEYYVDRDEYYVPILFHTYPSSMVVMTLLISADGLFIISVMHVCGVIAVIGHRLENLAPKRFHTDDKTDNTLKDDCDECYDELVLCIDHHFRITELAISIESSYSMAYLIVLGLAVCCLSLSAVQILIKMGQIHEMIRLIQFNLAQCGHLFFNSWPCQRLIDESTQFRESLYTSEWYSLSEKNKKLLRFVMLRTLEPQKITAGRIYLMSMENFGVVIKTSLSYFTVFASVR